MAGGQVEELEDALHAGPGLLADGEDAGELAGRRHQLGDVGREGEERAEGDLVVEGQPAAQREDRHLREQRDRLEERLIPRLQAHGPHL